MRAHSARTATSEEVALEHRSKKKMSLTFQAVSSRYRQPERPTNGEHKVTRGLSFL